MSPQRQPKHPRRTAVVDGDDQVHGDTAHAAITHELVRLSLGGHPARPELEAPLPDPTPVRIRTRRKRR